MVVRNAVGAETPTIASTVYASSAYGGNDLTQLASVTGQPVIGATLDVWKGPPLLREDPSWLRSMKESSISEEEDEGTMAAVTPVTKLRVVQVWIADTNENIPLDKRILYKGDPKVTEDTDQELFFEINIKEILEKHNAERVKFVNKAVKDRTEYLEPVKIRDLKMTVVNLAQF